QGPTVGLDFGGDGSKVMMLVYNLNSVEQAYGRYPGVDGSAYVVGGLGMTVIKYGDVVMVPIRSGVGLRAGLNVGYLKFTDQPTWNPF
uniref:EipA family protein n=1 Tax=Devosia sp. TaxID=1871048 RepID=UPI0037BE5544